jgi:hypothetical protein
MKKQARVLRPVPIRQWVLSMSVLSGAGPTPQPGGARKTALVRPIRTQLEPAK